MARVPRQSPYGRCGARQPAAWASASEQNQRSPADSSIFVTSYDALPGTW